ncbi:unnamed protein product [Calypogeia fissa]
MASASALLITILVALTFASVPIKVVNGCGINIVNSCPYAITICAQSEQNPIIQYQLDSGAQQFLDLGSACQWPAAAIWPSDHDQCAVANQPNAPFDINLANLAEFTIGDGTGSDYYDLSNVSINVTSPVVPPGATIGRYLCGSVSCVISDIRAFCQGSNQLITLPNGRLSCINTDGSLPGPTPNNELFKAACPDAFDPFDEAAPTFMCGTGSNYTVTFCPSGITLATKKTHMDLDL